MCYIIIDTRKETEPFTVFLDTLLYRVAPDSRREWKEIYQSLDASDPTQLSIEQKIQVIVHILGKHHSQSLKFIFLHSGSCRCEPWKADVAEFMRLLMSIPWRELTVHFQCVDTKSSLSNGDTDDIHEHYYSVKPCLRGALWPYADQVDWPLFQYYCKICPHDDMNIYDCYRNGGSFARPSFSASSITALRLRPVDYLFESSRFEATRIDAYWFVERPYVRMYREFRRTLTETHPPIVGNGDGSQCRVEEVSDADFTREVLGSDT